MYHMPRFLVPYTDKVSKFNDIAKTHAENNNTTEIHCLCADHKNEKVRIDVTEVMKHLVIRGFMDDYIIWTHHGKHQVDPDNKEDWPHVDDLEYADGDSCGDITIDLDEMLCRAEPVVLIGLYRGLDNFEAFHKTMKEYLYDESKGCDNKLTTLQSVLELIMRLKARYGSSDSSFDSLFCLTGRMYCHIVLNKYIDFCINKKLISHLKCLIYVIQTIHKSFNPQYTKYIWTTGTYNEC